MRSTLVEKGMEFDFDPAKFGFQAAGGYHSHARHYKDMISALASIGTRKFIKPPQHKSRS